MKVEMVVERQGKRMTFTMIAVDATKADALAEAAQQETWAVRSEAREPRRADRGDPRLPAGPRGRVGPGAVPLGHGLLEVSDDLTKAGNMVVVQGTEENGFCVGLVVADGRVYGNATAKVKFLLMKGERSASAGIVVRAKDRKNYYLARVDGVTQDLAIVKMEHAEAKVLATTAVKSPKLNTWHTMTVTTKGNKLTVTLGDGTTLSAEDDVHGRVVGPRDVARRGHGVRRPRADAGREVSRRAR